MKGNYNSLQMSNDSELLNQVNIKKKKKKTKARYLFYQFIDNNNKVYLDPTLVRM